MQFRVVYETNHRMRIRLYTGRISDYQEEVLQFAFSAIDSVTKVTVYHATGNIALEYQGNRDLILEKLRAFDYDNVTMMAEKLEKGIDMDEMLRRKLDPALKQKLRMRILLETAADLVLPVPMQLGYHAYQLVTLKHI